MRHSIDKALLRQEVDVHGKIYTDGEFGSLKLSDDLGRWAKLSFKLWRDKIIIDSLLYVAEKKRPKTFPFLSQGEVADSAEVRGGT